MLRGCSPRCSRAPMPESAPRADKEYWLPDFCSLPVIGAMLVAAELVILIVLFAPGQQVLPTREQLLAGSFLAQLIALSCAVSVGNVEKPMTYVLTEICVGVVPMVLVMPAFSAAAAATGSPWQLSAPSVSKITLYLRQGTAASHLMRGDKKSLVASSELASGVGPVARSSQSPPGHVTPG